MVNCDLFSDIVGEKPNYEVGSKAKLSFGKKPASAGSKVWKLDVDDDDEIFINADDLLDEEDKQKPTEESLRVCATTGKRKACKDCSCGLAEELDAEAKGNSVDNNPTQKSSCGSVSLDCCLSSHDFFIKHLSSAISVTLSAAPRALILAYLPSSPARRFKSLTP